MQSVCAASASFPSPRQTRKARWPLSKPGLRAPRRDLRLAAEGARATPAALAAGHELDIAYARVSTDSGEQLDALRRQIYELESLQPPPQHILTEVQSGCDTDREQYLELKQLVEERRVKRVRLTHASRLGRNIVEALSFIQLADENACTIETLKEGVLSLRDSATTVTTVLHAAFAQNESRELSVRICRGYEAGRKMKKPMRKPPWGYRLSEDRMRLEPHPTQFREAQEVIAFWRENEYQSAPTWKHPKVPFKSIRGLTKWLDNPILRGGMDWNVSRVDEHGQHVGLMTEWDLHERLISDDDYINWLTRKQRNAKMYGANHGKQVRALTGLMRCTECLHKMKYIGGRSIASLRCSGDGCSQHYRGVREEDVVEWAIKEIAAQAAERLASQVGWKAPPEADALQREVERLERDHGSDPDYADVITKKRTRLEGMLLKPPVDEQLLHDLSLARFWSSCEGEFVIEMLQRVVREIQITNQQPTKLVLAI